MDITTSLAYRGPEWMLKVALDDDFRVTETFINKDGVPSDVTRRASLKERLSAAKDASCYYAPKLQSMQHNITASAVDKMTDDELRDALAEAAKFLLPAKEEVVPAQPT